jgi:hypothetical protein
VFASDVHRGVIWSHVRSGEWKGRNGIMGSPGTRCGYKNRAMTQSDCTQEAGRMRTVKAEEARLRRETEARKLAEHSRAYFDRIGRFFIPSAARCVHS